MKRNIIAEKKQLGLALLYCIILSLGAFIAYSLPAAPGLTYISNSTSSNSGIGENITNDLGGGYIMTINLDVLQQNLGWKAYVGNVSGRFVLEDSDGYSIYEWDMSLNTEGKVFASRNGTVDWTSINCSNRSSSVDGEETYLGITGSDSDSINSTFNYTAHKTFGVAGRSMNLDSCPSIATFYNNSEQTPSATAKFQEVLLSDNEGNGNLVYTSIMEADEIAYRNDTTFDFQMIVADSESVGVITNYYFYVELGI
ncbi:hypothetical protein C0585_00010 [Candidatus Woesearchaeota archaeon]|nr:MAG: hypothetical protein C0585_00010 [Candidatus Woesearchaeota archaeon]